MARAREAGAGGPGGRGAPGAGAPEGPAEPAPDPGTVETAWIVTVDDPPRLARLAVDREAELLTIELFTPEGWEEMPEAVEVLRDPEAHEVSEDEATVVAATLVGAEDEAAGAAPPQ